MRRGLLFLLAFAFLFGNYQASLILDNLRDVLQRVSSQNEIKPTACEYLIHIIGYMYL